MQEDQQKIIQLLISQDKTNNKLALQLLKGDPELKTAVKAHFQAILNASEKKTLKAVPKIIQELIAGKGVLKARLQIGTVPELYNHINKLYLNNIALKEIPEWIQHLPKLNLLALSGCGLKKLPEWLGKLKSLEFFSIANNDIELIPESFGELERLRNCYLIENQIKCLPGSIGRLKNLKYLYVTKKNPISRVELAKIKALLPHSRIF
ncbi:MAG: leucine-rich repeat domain-containing protein [Saprospiraceae bacterium]|nr:leucine-rich repeat domain-containing protein [Saprospiraceae bacterium]